MFAFKLLKLEHEVLQLDLQEPAAGVNKTLERAKLL